MSRVFDSASTEYISTNTAAITGVPFSMACWYYRTDDTILNTLLFCGQSTSDDNYAALSIEDVGDGSNPSSVRAHSGTYGGTARNAYTSTAATQNTWEHACGVWKTLSDTKVYIDGGNVGSDGTTGTAESGHDRTTIGALRRLSGLGWMDGRIAEAAIWDIALSVEEVESLAAGYSPRYVRPEGLVLYVPMSDDEDYDIIGGLTFATGGTPTVAAHPAIKYPHGRRPRARA